MSQKLLPIDTTRIIKDPALRRAAAIASHYWFFHLYLSHYVKYPTADFQREMFAITEDERIKNAVIVAFRGSSKSTIMSLSYPIWAMVGKQAKKFIIILSQTQQQSRLLIANVRKELETNSLLISDFGPYIDQSDEWRINSLVIPRYGTRIMALSVGENIRGLRHMEHRPDLIICDDVEDLQSVKTKELRDKLSQWFFGDVIPAGNERTRLFVVGSLLHEDSLTMRLKDGIGLGTFDGIFSAYPLIDDGTSILWPGRYPNLQAIETLRKSVGNEAAWNREYLLKIISDEGRVVYPEWFHYYDNLPDRNKVRPRLIIISFDPAISQEATADYTAALIIYVYGYGEDLRIYISPYILNKRLTFPQTIQEIKNLCALSKYVDYGPKPRIYIEDVGYQVVLAQQLKVEGLSAEPIKVYGRDKRARLNLTTDYIKSGKVLFSRKGNELLIQQLIGFGVEKHDDLVDAFTLAVNKIIEDDRPRDAGVNLGVDKGCGVSPIITMSEIDRALGHSSDEDIMTKQF